VEAGIKAAEDIPEACEECTESSRDRNRERNCGVGGETAGATQVRGAETMPRDEASDNVGSVEEETQAVAEMEAGVCLSALDFDRDLGAAGMSSKRTTANGASETSSE
jgi:hypothetical protein